jgi:CubicO group peptidase (beta-lactamase class C family)
MSPRRCPTPAGEPRMRHAHAVAGAALSAAVIAMSASSHVGAQAAAPAPRFETPRFADPDRRAKLSRAFPDIDRLVRDFMAREHLPGAVWGVLIDGELVHVGTAGVRDVPSKAPVNRTTVFRIASMTKSFTAMAILKLRDEGRLGRLTALGDSPPAVPCRRLP